jgi:hypothetical protein
MRETTIVAAASVRAELDARHHLRAIETEPRDRRVDGLVGRRVGPGFRAAVDAALPEPPDRATPLYLLLDDLPVAALISGYTRLYGGELDSSATEAGLVRADICAGWRSGGTMLVSLRETGAIPVPRGPVATELASDGDALGWHHIEPLARGAMRRRRLVEVTEGEPMPVFATFRDTHVPPDGVETVLHEYAVTAALDPDSLVLSSCVADPRALPWDECPAAAASAQRLDGHHADGLRALVRAEFRGITTCTHLNDLFRSMGDVGQLARLLR